MLGRGGRGTEGLFQERDAHALGAADLPASVAGVQGFPFIISANRASRTEMILPSWASPEIDLIQKGVLVPGEIADPFGQRSRRRCPNAVSTFLAWRGSKRSTAADVLPFEQADLQVPHEPGRRHPEIIPHHHDRLNMLAIAMTKSGDQFRVLLTSLGVEPLLELVQDQQHLPLRWQDATPSQVRQRIDQPRSLSGSSGHALRKPLSSRASVSSGVASM